MAQYSPKSSSDVEKGEDGYLYNDSVHTFSWASVSVTVPDKPTKQPKLILSDLSGSLKAGELVALMGPSGCGKTTLLNVLARRAAPNQAKVEGTALLNGVCPSTAMFQRLSGYVEQDDSLIGSLTARETIDFAARLAFPSNVSSAERILRVNELIESFGLQDQANTLIGTPIRKGLSGGQKRRVGVASQLITAPKVLFLDEPTSGLDSVASYEVMSYLKNIVTRNKLIVIASIHQPSTTTFRLFDKLFLLSKGKLCFSGPLTDIEPYFSGIGFPMPSYINPAEFLLELVNVDFVRDRQDANARLEGIQAAWAKRSGTGPAVDSQLNGPNELHVAPGSSSSKLMLPFTLLHRSAIKSYRDVFSYGIRVAMYMGLAIMMGTVWLRLKTKQEDIQPFINALFFGSAFMSFMAVAYVPAYLEDRATFIKERANGLYGATSFMVANFLIGIPWLFLIAVVFSLISYWLVNFRPTAGAFMTWIMWVFLDLLAAESLVVLVSSVFPTFVVALALAAFANGFWMSVGGFLVTPVVLNVFWRYWARYIDYQAWVFQGMMINELAERVYSCDADCHCMYPSELASQCEIAGSAVLKTYGYGTGGKGRMVGYMFAIILVYRLLGWVVLHLRKT